MRKKILASVVVAVCLALAAGPAVAQTPGTIKWNFVTEKNVDCSPSLGPDGTIYFGYYGGKFYALNPDGSKKWDRPVCSIGVCSPLVTPDGSSIIIGDYCGDIYCFDPYGNVKWRFPIGYPIYATPSLGKGCIYIPIFTLKWGKPLPGKVCALHIETGFIKWEYPTLGPLMAPAAVGLDGSIYFGGDTNDPNLNAINPDGTTKWAFPLDGGTHYAPAIGPDGTIYIKGYAINPDGTQKWKHTNTYSNMVVGADGTIYVGGYTSGSTPALLALNPNDGSEKWAFTGGTVGSSTPAVGADGTIYFASGSNVFAVKPDGNQKWVCPTPAGNIVSGSAPVIAPDGTIYVGLTRASENGPGGLLAIYGDSPGLPRSSWPMFQRNSSHTGSLLTVSPISYFFDMLLGD